MAETEVPVIFEDGDKVVIQNEDGSFFARGVVSTFGDEQLVTTAMGSRYLRVAYELGFTIVKQG